MDIALLVVAVMELAFILDLVGERDRWRERCTAWRVRYQRYVGRD